MGGDSEVICYRRIEARVKENIYRISRCADGSLSLSSECRPFESRGALTLKAQSRLDLNLDPGAASRVLLRVSGCPQANGLI